VVGAAGSVDAGWHRLAQLAAAVGDEQLAAVELAVDQHGAAEAIVARGLEADAGGRLHLVGEGVAVAALVPGVGGEEPAADPAVAVAVHPTLTQLLGEVRRGLVLLRRGRR